MIHPFSRHALLVTAGLIGYMSTPALATTVCNNNCDYDTLYKAVYYASPGDTLTLEEANWEEHSIIVDKDIRIEGGQWGAPSVIDGMATDSLFIVDGPNSPTLYLNNLILQNGDATQGGAVRVEQGALNTQFTVFRDNRSDDGGAIYLGQSTSLYAGRAVAFTENLGVDGGAVSCRNCNEARFRGVIFAGNSSSGHGGALDMEGAALVRADYTVFTDNTAQQGGALDASGTASIVLSHTQFSNNRATTNGGGSGGALHINGAQPTAAVDIAFSTFENNLADSGGAGGAAAFVNTGFPGSPTVTARIWNSTFSANAAISGGAIQAMAPNSVRIHNATMYENRANFGPTTTFLGSVDLNNSIVVRQPDQFGQTKEPCDNLSPLTSTHGGNLMDDPTNSCSLGDNPVTDISPSPVIVNGKRVHTIGSTSNARETGVAGCPRVTNPNWPLWYDQTRQRRNSAVTGSLCDVGAYEYRP